jgi:transcriptional antiterminator RfaH
MTAWYAVHTQPMGEQRAAANLARQGYATYLPLYRCRRSHARKVDLVQKPLFPRYLFVALDMLRDRWRPILSTFGVSSIVRVGDAPVPVPEGVVDAIRAHESAHTFDQSLEPARRFKPGMVVRVTGGPFADLIGKFQGLADTERVIVLLDLLGREVRVHVPNRAVVAA